ncbi:hypothetical protein TcCL_ESM04541 [Trypanosoma cruzi]|nr:hypothetical protein TcCL_ESM04541 [Trypanosoma cruzi]
MPSGRAQVGNHHQFPGAAARHGFPLNAALVVMPWDTSPRRRRSCYLCWKRVGAPGDGAVGTIVAGEGRHTTIFPEGRSIVWRTHSRRVALREEEDWLPRRRVGLCTFHP